MGTFTVEITKERNESPRLTSRLTFDPGPSGSVMRENCDFQHIQCA